MLRWNETFAFLHRCTEVVGECDSLPMQVEAACTRALHLRQECPQALQAHVAEYLAACQPLAKQLQEASPDPASEATSDHDSRRALTELPAELPQALGSAAAKLPAVRCAALSSVYVRLVAGFPHG